MPEERWKCTECRKAFEVSKLLKAKNPFTDKHDPEQITGCPNCKSVATFTLLCDEPGCGRDVSCGWNSPAGYRRTCSVHFHRHQQDDK